MDITDCYIFSKIQLKTSNPDVMS